MFVENWFQYFNPRIPIWQSSPPPDVGKGLEIGINAKYYNSASTIQAMSAHISIRDPSGNVIASVKPSPVSIYMGGDYGNILTTTKTTKEGDYIATAILYSNGSQIDTWQGIVATVGAAEVTGKIYPERFYYWNDDIDGWQDSPPEDVKVNTVGIQADGRNTGTGTQNMAVEIKIMDPSGNVIKTEKPALESVPVNGFAKAVAYIQPTINGTYTANITLFADSQVLDSWAGNIAINIEKGEPGEKYTKIVSVNVTPSKPIPGDTIEVKVGVQNKISKPIYIRIFAYYNGQSVIFNPNQLLVGIAATRYFNYTFSMPNKRVSMSIYSQYLTTSEEWYDDDLANITITPYEEPHNGNGGDGGEDGGIGGIPWWVWVAGGGAIIAAIVIATRK